MQSKDDTGLDVRFIREVGEPAAIAALVEPALQGLGFRLVRVEVSGRDGKTVQIMAERGDGSLTIDDCETISKVLSPLLDVHEPVAGSYRFEVSSPGIDRPLVRPSDFDTWAGHEVKIELKGAVDGRRRFRGTIEGFAEGEVRLQCDLPEHGSGVIGIGISDIATARLVLTDELIREALSRAKQRTKGGLGDGSETSPIEAEED